MVCFGNVFTFLEGDMFRITAQDHGHLSVITYRIGIQNYTQWTKVKPANLDEGHECYWILEPEGKQTLV